MDKSVLEEYIDACEIIKETRQEIKRLSEKRHQIVQDCTKGSSHDFPYTLQTYHLEGYDVTTRTLNILERKEKLLHERIERASTLKCEVEEWLNAIPYRMQRIIRYRFFEELTWEQVATKIGRKATADSIRMEYKKFMRAA